MNSYELVTSITVIACSMAKQFTRDELAILASAFTQLGDTIDTILTHEEITEKN